MAHKYNSKSPPLDLLTSNETITTFTRWKNLLTYHLEKDPKFQPFLREGVTWSDSDTAHRGFTSDTAPIPAEDRLTKEDKAHNLNLMLTQIYSWGNIIAKHQIVDESISMNYIWALYREHFGFHVTGSRYLDLSSIRQLPDEKPSDLYQRILSFFTDNLHTRESNLKHKGKDPTSDERLSVSLQNVVVVIWLERLHTSLPALVKQRYATELRNKTLASIKPEISQALDSLLEELRSSADDTRVLRSQPPRSSYGRYQRNQSSSGNSKPRDPSSSNPRYCSLCKSAGFSGYDTHFLSQCKHISERDRKMMNTRVRLVETDERYELEDDYTVDEISETTDNSLFIDKPLPSVHRRVITRRSPHMSCFFNHYPAHVCLDSGSESSLISERFAKYADIPILPQTIVQGAVQADSTSRLNVVGEVKNVKIRRGAHVFTLDALVTKDDVGDIIAGEPFLEINDIALRPSKKQIIIKGQEIVPYANSANL